MAALASSTKQYRILTVSDYVNIFGCSEKTASKYHRQDLETLGRKRITDVQFEALYGSIDHLKIGK